MRSLAAILVASRLGFGACFVAAELSSAWAQPGGFQLRFLGQPPQQTELTPPHVDLVSGTTATRLEQARALAAGRNWDESIEILGDLAADKSGRMVAIDDSRFLSLRTYCQLQLARLPAEGLAAYRRRVDALAEQWFRDAIASRDEQLLRRVVDESFCSSWGDDALLALGELALERGDYASARRNWEQISPMLRAPNGMPMWLALRGIDLNAHWPEVERRWQTRKKPPDWLAYPDTQLDLADIRARLVLVSIRAGELERAAFELQMFRRLHPQAAGALGGQRENYVTALERLIETARHWPAEPAQTDWPTFAGSQNRDAAAAPVSDSLAPVWKKPIPLSPPTFSMRMHGIEDDPALVVRESQRPISCYPVAVDALVFFADAHGICAAELATGKSAITNNGVLSDESASDFPLRAGGGVIQGDPRLSLNISQGVLYARTGPLATSHSQDVRSSPGSGIIGLDLNREALLSFRARPEDGSWSFDGTPVCDGRRLYVAMRHSDVTPQAYVACFDAANGAQQWRTSIGAADTPAGGADEITHNLLTLVEDRIYFNSNLGLVAALDAATGEICWLTGYPRADDKLFTQAAARPIYFDRGPSPCVYHAGILYVAPSDSPMIFAIDAETGKTIWRLDRLPDALHLLAVVGTHLIVSGERIAGVDFATGRVDWIWPESTSAGIRGIGRGVVAGNEVFWPTRDAIYVMDAKTGAQTRPPINLAPLAGGANLAVSRGRLIAAGYDKLMVFGPPNATPPEAKQPGTEKSVLRTSRLSEESKTQ